MKFEHKKIEGLGGQAEDVYTQYDDSGVPVGFAIAASAKGVSFSGMSLPFTTADDMNLLAQTIGKASNKFIGYKKAIRDQLTLKG